MNQRLQKEKQEVLNQKHKAEDDSKNHQETIRKLNADIEKLKNEIKELEGKEARAREAHAQQMNRAHLLNKELEEANKIIKELNERIKRLEDEVKNLREAARRGPATRGSRDTSSIDSSTTGGPGGSIKSRSTISTIKDEVNVGPSGAGTGGDGTGDEIYIPSSDDKGGDRPGTGGPGGTSTTIIRDRDGRIVEPSSDLYHDDELVNMRVRDINDKWKREFEKIESQKEDLEKRIKELEDQLDEVNRNNTKESSDVAELKRKHEGEIDRLKTDIAALHDKHMSDLDDEREQYSKAIESIKAAEDELRNKVQSLEKQLADALNREGELERERRDYDEKLNTLYQQNQKLRDDLEDLRINSDKVISTFEKHNFEMQKLLF